MAGFPKVGDQYGGRYRIMAEVGHGGMGVVYQAQDTVLNRSVALKIALPALAERDEYHQRFAQEAAALAKIQSRHIVGIFDYGEHEDTVFFATQFFPDGDLQSWIVEHGPLDRRAALTLVAQVCEALADAHAAGVVHRDVKPGNVLLWSRPEGLVPYLADFGIAVEGAPEKRSGLTRTGTLIGSPAYMAPERHFGHPADERGDVYSAGCLLWAALTGDAPYSGTDFQMMNSHINAAVVTLGSDHPVDERIDAVLTAALEKDPDRRIPSAAEMRTQLLDIVREIDSSALPTPLPPTAVANGTPDGGLSEVPADRTTIRPVLVPTSERAIAGSPGSASGPPSGPPSGAPPTDPERRRRWLAPVLVGAAVILVVAIVSALLVSSGGDDGPEAGSDEPTESATTTAPPPPPTPKQPAVEATSRYRSVVFTLAPAAAGSTTEVDTGDGWQPAKRERVSVPTSQGGEKACLRARNVAEDDGQRSISEITRECGRAVAPTAQLVATTESCYGEASNGFTGACRWYAVRLSGFTTGTSPHARTRCVAGVACDDLPDGWCPTSTSCRRLEVGRDGRAEEPHFFRIFDDSGTWVLDVDGVTDRTELNGP